MRFAWVGFHAEGIPALEALLASQAPVDTVITLAPYSRAKRAAGVDYHPVCERYGVPLHEVSDINGPEAKQILFAAQPDVIFVIGWHQILKGETLRLARIGCVGAHASLLPANRGSAPINWSIIRGDSLTGNSLIWLAEDVDAGDIIDQTEFPITPYDTCATLYEKVAASNRNMLLRLVPKLLAGQRPGRRQPLTGEPVNTRRRPGDGLVDWSQPSRNIYDFIRALTRPYPGAFSTLDGRRFKVWQAALAPARCAPNAQPGDIVGPVVSPVSAACGQLVACGQGALILLEVEAEDGTVLRGRPLGDQQWTGKRWHNA